MNTACEESDQRRRPCGSLRHRVRAVSLAIVTSADEKAALQAVARPGFAAATRARVLPVALGPALTGAVAAWALAGRFSWAWLGVLMLGAIAGHLSFNVLGDVIDDASGADDAARADLLSVPTSSGAISAAYPRRRALRNGIVLVLVALASGVALSVARAPSVLALGALAYALVLGAVAPPVRFASRVPASGEAAAVIAGMLQTAAAYAAMAERIDLVALRLGIVPGLLIANVVFHQQFLRHRSDLVIGRPGTVSRLGAHKGAAVSIVVLLAPFVALAVQVGLGVWPAWALVAVVALAPQLLAWARLRAEIGPLDNFITLFGATLGSTALANLLLVLGLVAERLAR